jgi:hypothetical protein
LMCWHAWVQSSRLVEFCRQTMKHHIALCKVTGGAEVRLFSCETQDVSDWSACLWHTLQYKLCSMDGIGFNQ